MPRESQNLSRFHVLLTLEQIEFINTMAGENMTNGAEVVRLALKLLREIKEGNLGLVQTTPEGERMPVTIITAVGVFPTRRVSHK